MPPVLCGFAAKSVSCSFCLSKHTCASLHRIHPFAYCTAAIPEARNERATLPGPSTGVPRLVQSDVVRVWNCP